MCTATAEQHLRNGCRVSDRRFEAFALINWWTAPMAMASPRDAIHDKQEILYIACQTGELAGD